MQVGLAEFIEKVAVLKTDEEKINALRYNDSEPLRYVLKGAFDPSVKWLIPPGEPPYRPSVIEDQEHILINQIKKLHYFVEGMHDNIKPLKRETMFIEFLETVSPADAKMLCAMKEKRLHVSGINIRHVGAAIPDLIENWENIPIQTIKEEAVNAPNNFPAKDKIVCPHCGKEGTSQTMMTRYHFDNCKNKKELQVESNEQIQA